MWFFIKLVIVSFISTFPLFGTSGSDKEWPGLTVSGTSWMLFGWSCIASFLLLICIKDRQINKFDFLGIKCKKSKKS